MFFFSGSLEDIYYLFIFVVVILEILICIFNITKSLVNKNLLPIIRISGDRPTQGTAFAFIL